MAIIFDTSVGGTATTSYVDVAEYNAYVEKLIFDTDELPTSDQITQIQKLLIAATQAVNGLLYSADGEPSSSAQKLEYPRSGSYDRRDIAIDSNTIPQSLKDAVCEMANFLFLNGVNTNAHDSWNDDVDSAEITSSISFTYKTGQKPPKMVPVQVKELITNITGRYPSPVYTLERG